MSKTFQVMLLLLLSTNTWAQETAFEILERQIAAVETVTKTLIKRRAKTKANTYERWLEIESSIDVATLDTFYRLLEDYEIDWRQYFDGRKRFDVSGKLLVDSRCFHEPQKLPATTNTTRLR